MAIATGFEVETVDRVIRYRNDYPPGVSLINGLYAFIWLQEPPEGECKRSRRKKFWRRVVSKCDRDMKRWRGRHDRWTKGPNE